MCGQSDDRNVLGLRVAFQTPRGFPAVNNRHFEVHQDNIRLLGRRYLAPFLAVLGRENLEIPKKLEPHFEHIDVVVVVFDIKHLDHEAAPLPLRTAGLLGHLALIFTGADRHPRVAKSKFDRASLRAPTANWNACNTPATRLRRPLCLAARGMSYRHAVLTLSVNSSIWNSVYAQMIVVWRKLKIGGNPRHDCCQQCTASPRVSSGTKP